ncbi:MAG: 50S ribosomal protein L1 [Candidatus Aenigmarchaeota archaeon]|nr:50S ribosomal protein L1 [Candidatus Aenigmarchaeota archaeon]
MIIDKEKKYLLSEAVELVKQSAKAKFDEGVELHLSLGIDSKKGDQQVKGAVHLLHPVKEIRIAAFVASSDKVKEVKDAGADLIGGEELVKKIKGNKKCNFDLAVAEPSMMKHLAQIARILGPRGLMPTPKSGTVTEHIGKVIAEFKKGKINFKNDQGGNIHQLIGKVSWSDEQLIDNIDIFVKTINKNKPAGCKGIFIKNVTVASTMGQGIKLDLTKII